METQDFNTELMDYLYGEMSAEEKKKFEVRLAGDQELQEEYRTLSAVRAELDILGDKEVMEPFSTWGKTKGGQLTGPLGKRRFIVFRPVAAVAAALLLFMLLGYVTKFSVSINDQGFYLGFGKQEVATQDKYLTEEQVAELIHEAVRKSNEEVLTQLSNSEESYDQRLTSIEQKAKKRDKEQITPEFLENYFTAVEKKNAELMKDFLTRTTAQQQEYYKSMFTQFSEFYLEQRDNDMTMISNSLLQLQENQNIQKQETDQALAGLYTSVNQRRN